MRQLILSSVAIFALACGAAPTAPLPTASSLNLSILPLPVPAVFSATPDPLFPTSPIKTWSVLTYKLRYSETAGAPAIINGWDTTVTLKDGSVVTNEKSFDISGGLLVNAMTGGTIEQTRYIPKDVTAFEPGATIAVTMRYTDAAAHARTATVTADVAAH